MINLWDSHCHLFSEYYENIEEILNQAINNGVTHFIVSGCDQKSNEEVLSLIEKYPFVYGVIGIHPEEVENYQESDIHFVRQHLNHPKILGIGEIGLDYYYSKDSKEKQMELFEKQLKIAEEYNLPVVIHSREATNDTIQILKNFHGKGVIHSFTGSLEIAQIYIKMGYKLGINGVVTFKNSKLKELLPSIFSYIILETDSPYLTPHPYRGTKNESKYIKNIAEFIAKELNVSLNQVEKVTNENIRSLFDKLN